MPGISASPYVRKVGRFREGTLLWQTCCREKGRETAHFSDLARYKSGLFPREAYVCGTERMKIAVFPGSFDPITAGHVDLVHRAVPLFDKVVVAVGINSKKQSLFSLEQRMQWLRDVFRDDKQVFVDSFEGLTVQYCKKIQAKYLLRGLRNASDFDYEKTISQLNYIIGNQIETIFLISRPEFSHISSTIVREIIIGRGDAKPFLPAAVEIPADFRPDQE